MKKIGMLVAVELGAVLRRYGEPKEALHFPGYEVQVYENDSSILCVLCSGSGEIPAAAGTQLLITALEVDMILNFGVAGGLTEKMCRRRLCVAERIVHYDHDVSQLNGNPAGHYTGRTEPWFYPTKELAERACALCPELVPVTCASGDRFVADPKEKAALHERFSADICEMEAAGVCMTALRSGVPCLIIKAVSDGLRDGAEGFRPALEKAADLCLETVDKILREL